MLNTTSTRTLYVKDGCSKSEGGRCKVLRTSYLFAYPKYDVLQGFARRYFTLNQLGTLSYSFEPGQPVRDQVSLHHAAITTAPGRKDIHVDSNMATFHMKCLNTGDFNMWMVAFRFGHLMCCLLHTKSNARKFISLGMEARKSASVRLLPRQGNASISLAKSETVAEEMGLVRIQSAKCLSHDRVLKQAIRTLDDAIQALINDLPAQLKKPNSITKKSDKDKNKDTGKEHKFSLFKKCESNPQESCAKLYTLLQLWLTPPYTNLEGITSSTRLLIVSRKFIAFYQHSNVSKPSMHHY